MTTRTTTGSQRRRGHRPVTLPAPEGMINNAPKVFTDFPVGTVSHQGDLIFIAIAGLPASATRRENRQLAEGDTRGSRHIVARGEVYDADHREIADAIKAALPRGSLSAEELDSLPNYCLAVFAGRGSSAYVPHPEHGSQEFPEGCTIAVAVQRNLDAEEREAAVQD